MTTTVLDEIIAHKRRELVRRKRILPQAALNARARRGSAPLDFAGALRPIGGRDGRMRLIAEIKRASPSRGALRPDLDPGTLAADYAANGAAAVSVLTDEKFFRGSLEDLGEVRLAMARRAAPIPVLRKDFVVDPYQVYESHAYGADAILLIVAALPGDLLETLLAMARGLGMDALVEVHDEGELARAVRVGARLIGINSRDLRDLSVDPAAFERLRPGVPPDVVVVAESGVQTVSDVQRLARLGADAVLVGEALVTAPDVAARVREFVSAAGNGSPGREAR